MELVKRDNIFNQTSPLKVDRNAFDLTHKVISSWDMGKLYPVSVHEVYPNDYEKTMIQTKMIFETMQKPIYQNLKANFYEFDVAYRNLWKHWRNYYTRGRKGNFTAQEPKVNLNCASNIKGSLFDYLGFPLQSQLKGDVFVSAFPFVAYDFIYFWNFINPELQENIVYNIQDQLFTESDSIGEYFNDELNLFSYYGKDFYLTNEDGIPLYTRMLGSLSPSQASNYTVINNSNIYGKNDRYSYLLGATGTYNHIPVGIMCYDESKKTISPYIWASPAQVGKIDNQSYRRICNIGFLYNVNWQRDYFTSAHLSQQQGSPLSIPINSNVSGDGEITGNIDRLNVGVKSNEGPFAQLYTKPYGSIQNEYYAGTTSIPLDDLNNKPVQTSPSTFTLNAADIASKLHAISSSFSNNDLRLVWQINMIKESVLFNKKNFEYASYLKYFFGRGPNTSDLQQPNFISSFSLDIFVGEVIQNSQTTETAALGDRGGIASITGKDYFDSYTFDEVGLSMIVMYIAPQTVYQSSQGINRMWLRNDSFDYYNPLLAHIGLQEVQNRELYATGGEEDLEPFGYTPAFNELRYIPDTVTSDMRDTLDIWHLARKYSQLPVLNSDYLLCRPSKRIYAAQLPDVPNITGIINIVKLAYRDMPELAIPELIDHRY